MSHPLAARLRNDTRAGLLRCPPQLAAPRPAVLRAEGDGKEECSCTGTAILAGMVGVVIGGVAGLAVSDAKKAEAKARAKARGAAALERGAARLRG